MQSGLINFPLPIITFGLALVAAALVARLDLGRGAGRWFFVGFFVLIATGSFLVGLRFGYGVEAMIPLQRSLPFFAGPLLYLGFVSFSEDANRLGYRAAVHLGAALALAVGPPLIIGALSDLEWLIGLSYLTYVGMLIWMWRKGSNHLTRARLEQAASLRRWMLWGALFLFAFLIMDGAIALSFAFQRADNALALISVGSVIMFALVLVMIWAVSRRSDVAQPVSQTQDIVEVTGLAQTADAYLRDTQIYLDTELTVDRLAKRLHVPTRALSAAINQSKSMNVSNYVNEFRLEHAARMLTETRDSVSAVMEQSGFLTRSNFYRAFQDKYGQSPASYRKLAKGKA